MIKGTGTRRTRCATRRRNVVRGVDLVIRGAKKKTRLNVLFLAALAIAARQNTNCISNKCNADTIIHQVVEYVALADLDDEVAYDDEDFEDNLCWECSPVPPRSPLQMATPDVLPVMAYYQAFVHTCPPRPQMREGVDDLLRLSGKRGVLFFELRSDDKPTHVMRGMSTGFRELLTLGLRWSRSSDPFYVVSTDPEMRRFGVVIDRVVCEALQTRLVLDQFKEDPQRVHPAAIFEAIWQRPEELVTVTNVVAAQLAGCVLEHTTKEKIAMELGNSWMSHYALLPELIRGVSRYLLTPACIVFGRYMLRFLLNTGRRWWIHKSAFPLVHKAIISSGTTTRFASLLGVCSDITEQAGWLRLSTYWYRVFAEVLVRWVASPSAQQAILEKLVLDPEDTSTVCPAKFVPHGHPTGNFLFNAIDALLPGSPSPHFATAPLCPLAADEYKLDQHGSTGHLSAVRPALLLQKDGTEVRFRHVSVLPFIRCDPLVDYLIPGYPLPPLRCLGRMT